MEDQEVRIVRLGPIRIASFSATGDSPELDAWARLRAWAVPRGLYDFTAHRFFGFDISSGTIDNPAHGYEFWITVGSEVESDGEGIVRDFPGGLYAVTRCEVRGDPYNSIPAAWQRLVDWMASSGRNQAPHQFLEEHLSPPDNPNGEWDMELYAPIEF